MSEFFFFYLFYAEYVICSLIISPIKRLKLMSKISCPTVQGTGPFATHCYVEVLDKSLPRVSIGRPHGKEARDCRQESGDLFLAELWVSFVTSGKSLLNSPEPWFPHLERRVGGHKRSFEYSIYLFLKMENFSTGVEPTQASLVPGAWCPCFFSCSFAPGCKWISPVPSSGGHSMELSDRAELRGCSDSINPLEGSIVWLLPPCWYLLCRWSIA